MSRQLPCLGAPLVARPCTCREPDRLTTPDGVNRCRRCAGIIERQPQLPAEWRTA